MKELGILKQMKQTLQSLLCVQDGRERISPHDFVTNLMVELSARQQAGLTGEPAARDEGAPGTDNQPQRLLRPPVAPAPEDLSARDRVSPDESSPSGG